MRDISFDAIAEAVRDLCIEANCALPDDLKCAISAARSAERSPVGQSILGDLVENFTFAGERRLPICQDTGMAVVFVELGQEVHITGGLLRDAVNLGVARGYTEGFLRKSVVRDPIRRVNTDDNTPAVLHLSLVEGDQLTITVAPKGFGSENMTSLHMLKPSVTQEVIEDTIVRAVSEAGSNPCPPVVVGVGLGGDAELAAILAKRALLRPVDAHNSDPFYAEMEARILEKINRLGIGPQGLGGTTTALAVAINPYPTHIAGLPCCVNLGCHVTRHASKTL
ncbi:MAG: fumarate hydratase [Oscillospiraceae bacterium]|nr:fumarate hydratase [Oscillospiraceae bacterium]